MKRNLRIEGLESRRMLNADVNLDSKVSAIDALQIINHLNKEGESVPAQFDNKDVNNDNRISALDALIVINQLDRSQNANAQVITVNLGPINTNGLSTPDILWAINESFYEFERIGNLDFQITSNPNANFSISSGELHLGDFPGQAHGTHARGWVLDGIGGRIVQFHNGHVSAENQKDGMELEWIAINSPDALKRILTHEFGHALMSWVHHPDPSCYMHTDGSSQDFCDIEKTSIVNRFGESVMANYRDNLNNSSTSTAGPFIPQVL